jgi:hypothetical protein
VYKFVKCKKLETKYKAIISGMICIQHKGVSVFDNVVRKYDSNDHLHTVSSASLVGHLIVFKIPE